MQLQSWLTHAQVPRSCLRSRHECRCMGAVRAWLLCDARSAAQELFNQSVPGTSTEVTTWVRLESAAVVLRVTQQVWAALHNWRSFLAACRTHSLLTFDLKTATFVARQWVATAPLAYCPP